MIEKLPTIPTYCTQKKCAYNIKFTCFDPDLYHDNGDSKCHDWSTKRTLQNLQEKDATQNEVRQLMLEVKDIMIDIENKHIGSMELLCQIKCLLTTREVKP